MAGLLVVVTNGKPADFFRLLGFVTKSLCSVGELNFNQADFLDERSGIASVTRLCSKSRLYLKKISLTELVLERRNASPLIKPFLVMYGWQDKKCVY